MPSRFLLAALAVLIAPSARTEWIWIEGENPVATTIRSHPWYSEKVRKDLLSEGNFLAHFDPARKGEATYRFQVSAGGSYRLWVRANPVQTSLVFSLNEDGEVNIPTGSPMGGTNLASDGKADLRYIGWLDAGLVRLRPGENCITFTMDSANNHHGALDCMVFTNETFLPSGTLKPDQIAQAAAQRAAEDAGWTAWTPSPEDFAPSPIDLRGLNEKFAGELGRIALRGDTFVHSANGAPVRFWGVNGTGTTDEGHLAKSARLLARYGVNLVRTNAEVFEPATGAVRAGAGARNARMVAAFKAEGIYSLLSIYFPLTLTPEPGPGWREGYPGGKPPFALLYFEPEFQRLYRAWWEEVLNARTPAGTRLIDEPALMGIELVNEDSFFFWTFNAENVPDPQLRKLERRFADWVAARHGSLEAAQRTWKTDHPRDAPDEGRLGFRSLYDIVTHRTPRDQETAAFLLEVQERFYQETAEFLRRMGFKGLITAGNWTTADESVLGPLEKISYLPGDFFDRHGYFGSNHQGENASWSLREGHTFSDVSALRFESEERGAPKVFSNPVMDTTFNGRPSVLSETAWNRPNRHRGEAPGVLALYGSLQGMDGIIHFAFDSFHWGVKPGFFMQPWTLTSPTQMGQFPATALIFRQQLVRPGPVVAAFSLARGDLLALRGTGSLHAPHLDPLRKESVPETTTAPVRGGLDPLAHWVGQVQVRLENTGGTVSARDLTPFIDRTHQKVTSATSELVLDYDKGVLTVNAPHVQGASGNLRAAGTMRLRDLTLDSSLEIGHIFIVPLDGRPLALSSRILVQAMSEEKASGFTSEPISPGVSKIVRLGTDPWLCRDLAGTIRFSRADAATLKVTALDANGHEIESVGTADSLILRPGIVYYLIAK